MSRITPHNFHRLALAVPDRGVASSWLQEVLGAVPMPGSDQLTDPSSGRDVGNLAGTESEILWIGGYPMILLSGGVVQGHLSRFGPGVQSWAWEIDDNWSAEHLLRDRGMDIISVNVGGRFFFMHPRQTQGLLWEWCDGKMGRDPEVITPKPGLLGTVNLAWITGLVTDTAAAAEWIQGLTDATVVDGNPRTDEAVDDTIDLQVGDVVVRLVSPRSDASRYASDLSERGPHVHSFALRVESLDAALETLAARGAGVIHRDADLVTTDPAGTLGLKIDWLPAH